MNLTLIHILEYAMIYYGSEIESKVKFRNGEVRLNSPAIEYRTLGAVAMASNPQKFRTFPE